MRTNKYKEKIIALFGTEHLLGLDDIRARLRDADFSTVFRNVEHLLAEGKIKKVVINNKYVLYELADHAHDHFVCDDCGTVESIELSHSVGQLKGRHVSDITVHGTCDVCVEVPVR